MNKNTPTNEQKTCPKMSKMGSKIGSFWGLSGRGQNRPSEGVFRTCPKNKHQNVAKIGRFWTVFQKWSFWGPNGGHFGVVFGVYFEGVFEHLFLGCFDTWILGYKITPRNEVKMDMWHIQGIPMDRITAHTG